MKWIKERRNELSLSQEDVARQLQLDGFTLTRATIGHWESGKARPPLNDPAFVDALARSLRLDATTVLQFSGFDIQTSHTEIAERVARLIDRMSAEDQLRALKVVEALLN